jgi:hypothetical protein
LEIVEMKRIFFIFLVEDLLSYPVLKFEWLG